MDGLSLALPVALAAEERRKPRLGQLAINPHYTQDPERLGHLASGKPDIRLKRASGRSLAMYSKRTYGPLGFSWFTFRLTAQN